MSEAISSQQVIMPSSYPYDTPEHLAIVTAYKVTQLHIALEDPTDPSAPQLNVPLPIGIRIDIATGPIRQYIQPVLLTIFTNIMWVFYINPTIIPRDECRAEWWSSLIKTARYIYYFTKRHRVGDKEDPLERFTRVFQETYSFDLGFDPNADYSRELDDISLFELLHTIRECIMNHMPISDTPVYTWPRPSRGSGYDAIRLSTTIIRTSTVNIPRLVTADSIFKYSLEALWDNPIIYNEIRRCISAILQSPALLPNERQIAQGVWYRMEALHPYTQQVFAEDVTGAVFSGASASMDNAQMLTEALAAISLSDLIDVYVPTPPATPPVLARASRPPPITIPPLNMEAVRSDLSGDMSDPADDYREIRRHMSFDRLMDDVDPLSEDDFEYPCLPVRRRYRRGL
jgi:hypothetical protein